MDDPGLRLRRVAYPVTTLGPGRRVVLWVTGCSRGCPGCISPELQDPAVGRELAISRVLSRLLAIDRGLDGITLTGGEPFEQARALAELLHGMAEVRPEWNVLVYSGYELTRLRQCGEAVRCLLEQTDILVAGPYLASWPQQHPLAGSGNQQVHYLSRRGRALRGRCEVPPAQQANLGAGPDGRDLLIGILSPAERARLHRELGLRTETAVHG
jgi:anaerobic ribonucleoside-triphosphate reductase activating protein